MKSKGQVLVLFIILIPIFFLVTAFITDTIILTSAKNKLFDVTKGIITDVLPDVTNAEAKVKDLYEKNGIEVKEINVETKDDKLSISVRSNTKTIFGFILGNDGYDAEIKLTGYYKLDKIVIEKG